VVPPCLTTDCQANLLFSHCYNGLTRTNLLQRPQALCHQPVDSQATFGGHFCEELSAHGSSSLSGPARLLLLFIVFCFSMILTHTPENVKRPKVFEDVHELGADEGEGDGFDGLTPPAT
jgi:hypothetical protein